MNGVSMSTITYWLGLASVIVSIVIWFSQGSSDLAHSQAIFVGLWAPTFLLLSLRFERQEQRKLAPQTAG